MWYKNVDFTKEIKKKIKHDTCDIHRQLKGVCKLVDYRTMAEKEIYR
jgi:hypothetical protein